MKQIKHTSFRSLLNKTLLTLALVLGSSQAWAQAKSVSGDGYFYGFENNDLATEGWTLTDCHANTGIASSSYTLSARTGSYLFKFYSSSGTQYLISPELENSGTGIDVEFYYNGAAAYSSGVRRFSVGYSTTNTETASFTFNDFSIFATDKSWFPCKVSFPTGTKYIAIKYYTNQDFYIDDFCVKEQPQYHKPSNLTVNSTTSSSATLSWTNGRDETAWKIAYSTDADFTPGTEGSIVDVNANPGTINGLIGGATYYFSVQAIYDGNHPSEWSEKIEVVPLDNLLLNDGGAQTLVAMPFHTKQVSTASNTKSQFVIPSSQLTSLLNSDIAKITFYAQESELKNEFVRWGNATFEVYMNEVESPLYASNTEEDYKEWGEKVYNEASLQINNYKMEIILTNPYRYKGGHLMIGVKQVASGTNLSHNLYWIALGQGLGNNYGLYTYSSTINKTNVCPKITLSTQPTTTPVTLGTNGYSTFACPRPLDLTAAKQTELGITAYKASVTGSTVTFDEIDQAVVANTGMLLQGEPGETYNIPVAASGTAVSENAFEVNTTGGTFFGDDDYYYFGMKKATLNTDPLTFAPFTPSTVAIPTNKAYLKVSKGVFSPGSHELTCIFDDGQTTGIKTIEFATPHSQGENGQLTIDNSFFNLAGQRVAQPTKGLYIVNGKKVIIK